MLLLTRSLALAGALLAAVAAAQTIDDDLLAAQMNYQRATRLAEKARQEADLARQNRQNAEGQLVTAQRVLDAAQAEQARAEAAERDAVTNLGLARQRLDATWGVKQQRSAQP